MSGRVVIYTSVIFKWFVAYGESGIDDACGLLKQHQEGELTLAAPS